MLPNLAYTHPDLQGTTLSGWQVFQTADCCSFSLSLLQGCKIFQVGGEAATLCNLAFGVKSND